MKLHCTILVALIAVIASKPELRKPSSVTTETLVVRHGYPFERHQVQTTDGYLLTIHRIPSSSRNETSSERPVAFLMHGLLGSSSDWVVLGPNNSLGFILADAGYDVWLGNARGNTYSRSHIKLSPLLSSFWSFDWHEIGMIDLPTMISYILSHNSKNTSISYYKTNSNPNGLPEIFGSRELLPNTKIQELLGYSACLAKSPVQELCSNLLFLGDGFNDENLNRTAVPDIVSSSPAGASINQLLHFMQEYKSGFFRQYDYGLPRNLHVYKNKEPPLYPIEKIENLPIFLYYGENDLMVAVVDVLRLSSKLSNSSLRRTYVVPDPTFNHLDFLWARTVTKNVYDVVLEDMASLN